jgi:hypothetical protein
MCRGIYRTVQLLFRKQLHQLDVDVKDGKDRTNKRDLRC